MTGSRQRHGYFRRKSSDASVFSDNGIFNQTDYTDRAGRKFAHISGLEYTAWCLDTNMLMASIKRLPIKDYPLALLRLQELKERSDEHGSHYNFSALISAYAIYIASMEEGDLSASEREIMLTDIAKEQSLMPKHLLLSFGCISHFDNGLTHSLTYQHAESKSSGKLFPLTKMHKGLDHTILTMDQGIATATPFHKVSVEALSSDIERIAGIIAENTEKLAEIEAQLSRENTAYFKPPALVDEQEERKESSCVIS